MFFFTTSTDSPLMSIIISVVVLLLYMYYVHLGYNPLYPIVAFLLLSVGISIYNKAKIETTLDNLHKNNI